MSIATQLTRLQTDRDAIRAKLVELGVAQSSDGLGELAAAVETIANRGAVSATIDGLNSTSVTIPAGYTSGGTVSLTDDIERALAAI